MNTAINRAKFLSIINIPIPPPLGQTKAVQYRDHYGLLSIIYKVMSSLPEIFKK